MKRISPYLKMKVLGALEFAEGRSLRERYKAVSRIIFRDEEGAPHQFTWCTIQTWWYYYRIHGITEAPKRSDKGGSRKITPEDLQEAVGKVLPGFHNKKYNIAEIYRACIEQGHLRRSQIAPNTFRRHVNKYDLLAPAAGGTPRPGSPSPRPTPTTCGRPTLFTAPTSASGASPSRPT